MSVTREVRGRVGHLGLGSTASLNALDEHRVRALADGLAEHEADPAVEAIVLSSADARAFCAGGDMKRIRERVLAAEFDPVDAFFREEYALVLAIARCTKPYVSLIDGIAMGGGLGISMHGSHRVLTENARLAMPETRIGLFPDVGGSHALPRLPMRAGWWLALCSEELRGHDGVVAGIGTHAVPAGRLVALVEALESGTDDIDATVRAHAVEPKAAAFREIMARRAPWFAGEDLGTIEGDLAGVAGLEQDAAHLQARLRAGSPFSVRATLDLFEGHAERDLEQALVREFAAVREAVRHPDFVEGVRAVLVDKDHSPIWAIGG